MSSGIIVSRPNKALIVPSTGQTQVLFPQGKALDLAGQPKLVVPHGHREFMLLKRLGYQVPNPMFDYYDWAGGKPFSVQKATCASMTAYPRSYVLNDMGTGKTRAALWAWDYLHGNGLCGKMLVVAPLSTVNFVWAREIFGALPGRKVQVLGGSIKKTPMSKKQRLERLNDRSADIYVINHDGLRVIEKELALRTDIDVLVLDELAVYRNNSDRSKRMRKFAARFPWVWGMTGRPMPTEVTDVWAQCKIVTPNSVPAFFNRVREMLMVKVNNYKYLPKADAVQQAFNMMRPHVRYSLDDVVELPDMVIPPPRDIPLSHEQDTAYKKMAREFQLMVKQQIITAANAAAAMGKLLQVSCGSVYTQAPKYVNLDSKPRQQELLDIIEGVEGKVIVFVPYRHALEELSKLLGRPRSDQDPTPLIEHTVVHGDVTGRDQIFNAFQNTPQYKALLAHPACLAHGITLTAARTIVWYGPIASLDIYDQANARIRRVGQTEKQQIIRFQSTPVEKKFYKLLETRQSIQAELLKMFEDATGAAT